MVRVPTNDLTNLYYTLVHKKSRPWVRAAYANILLSVVDILGSYLHLTLNKHSLWLYDTKIVTKAIPICIIIQTTIFNMPFPIFFRQTHFLARQTHCFYSGGCPLIACYLRASGHDKDLWSTSENLCQSLI